ncbi:MAG: heterodisulfide reductase subunit B [Candidatus Syntrophoarchaeum caldarius]|uniref:Heterodisulfide reductase subunit B n=1 Tax=Candidatus Syntropharchaeum caldarium TaxID=1838285 RepID=A0A1F2PAQ7_9EURY|nr:MAG: heterodisulfide reductase subunit B [Candidatus Syntrophoarchaeum caldarius]
MNEERYYLFKSCVLSAYYPKAEDCLRAIFDELGVEYVNDPAHSSCTGHGYHAGIYPLKTALEVNRRNFSLVKDSNCDDIVASCPTSYAMLKEMSTLLDEPIGVYHGSEVIYKYRDEISEILKYNLEGMRVVTHHGCHFTKIFYNDVTVGDAERPVLLDEIATSLGAEVIDYSERSLCCGMGFKHLLLDQEYCKKIALRKLENIKKADPDLILVHCPGCLLTLDRFQVILEKETGIELQIPVLNYTELITLLLGSDIDAIGAAAHHIRLDNLIKRIEK